MSTDRLGGRKTLAVTGFLVEFEKEEIKGRVDIVELFGSFGVKLAAKGKGFAGRCPWHEDSTPSLSVDREKGLYHCFGCGESGHVVAPVEKVTGLEFREALEYLRAKGGGVASNGNGRAARRVDQAPAAQPEPEPGMEWILDEVASRYTAALAGHAQARAYLGSRGLDKPEQLHRFRLGYFGDVGRGDRPARAHAAFHPSSLRDTPTGKTGPTPGTCRSYLATSPSGLRRTTPAGWPDGSRRCTACTTRGRISCTRRGGRANGFPVQ